MKQPKIIRLFIIEDHQFIVDLYIDFFKKYPTLEVLGFANDSTSALHKITELQPDLVLLDLQLKNSPLDGVDLIKEIRKKVPKIHLFVLTQFSGSMLLQNLIQAGVLGFREKSVGLAELTEAIIRVSEGFFDFQFQEENIQFPMFTDQERQILKLKGQGKTMMEVSAEMGQSVDVLDRMLRKMREQSGAVSTESLIYSAAKLHLI
jgi:DNA-binding NarL/FixJ family response regulator